MIELTDEMKAAFATSLTDGAPVLVATAGKSGMPDMAYKGSFMVFDKDHVAFWERAHGTTLKNMTENPQVCVFYRNAATRLAWKMFGVAELHAVRVASVAVARFRSERRHLHPHPQRPHDHHAERLADALRAADQRRHALRRGVGRHVEIAGVAPHQFVAHAPPGEVRRVARGLQRAHDLLRRPAGVPSIVL